MDELDGASSICDGILKALYHDPHKNFTTEGLLYLKGACRPDLSAQKQAISSQLAGLDFKSCLFRIFFHYFHLTIVTCITFSFSSRMHLNQLDLQWVVKQDAGKGLMSKLFQTLKKGSHEKVM